MRKQIMLMVSLTAGVVLTLAGTALAGSPWQLLGSAIPVNAAEAPNHWAIEMVCQHGSPSGGIKFSAPPGKLTFAAIRNLAVDYRVNADNTCLRDSPRLILELDSNGDGIVDKDIVVYLGPTPDLTACAKTWTKTGNLVTSTHKRFDTSQFDGGSPFDSYAEALRLAGKDTVVDILLIVDGGVHDARQDVLIDNLTVNNFKLTAQSLSPQTATVSLTP